jgi:hypothetical protein
MVLNVNGAIVTEKLAGFPSSVSKRRVMAVPIEAFAIAIPLAAAPSIVIPGFIPAISAGDPVCTKDT